MVINAEIVCRPARRERESGRERTETSTEIDIGVPAFSEAMKSKPGTEMPQIHL